VCIVVRTCIVKYDFSCITDKVQPNNALKACCVCEREAGEHHCRKCKKVVHAIPPCSAPDSDSEEGYGQLRICSLCEDGEGNFTRGNQSTIGGASNSNSGPSQRRQDLNVGDDPIVCLCNVEAVQLTVCKEGPNQGLFSTGNNCVFHIWIDFYVTR